MKFCRHYLLGFCLIIGVFLAYSESYAQISPKKEQISIGKTLISVDQQPSVFQPQPAQDNFINGILTGVVLLLIIYGFFLFLTVKDSLYLFYVSYVGMVCLWVLADQGYGERFLWPEATYFASRAKPVFNCLMNLSALHFMQAFIGQPREKRAFKVIALLKWTFLFLALLFLLPLNALPAGESSAFLLLLLLILNAMSTLLILWSVYDRLNAGYKQAWFYLPSIFPVLFFGMLTVLVDTNTVEMPTYFLSHFGMQTALIIQAIILTFGLAYRFNNYRIDREQLLLAVNKEQQEMTSKVLESQENERKKISDQLHDEVGTLLSIANWQLTEVLTESGPLPEKARIKLEKAAESIEKVSSTIRKLGHSLSPLAIQKYGLNRALTSLAYQINTSEKLSLEYAIFGFESNSPYPISFLNDLYRIIQELLNNIIKHAGASNAYLELVAHEDQASIIVEDNGKGFDNSISTRSSGIGLENIRAKIALFQGEMEIKRKAERGTIVVIRIPLP